MKKLLIALSTALALFAGGVTLADAAPPVSEAAVVAAVPPASPQLAQWHPYGPYTFLRTHGTGICIIDYLNAPTTHPVGDVGNAYEPSVQTGWRSPTQGCNDYPTYQTIRVFFYAEDDGACSKRTYTYTTDTTPDNHTYTDEYDSYINIFINTWYWKDCRDTQHIRVRVLSRAFGETFGLASHSACWATYTVMTSRNCPGQDGAWPGTHDRNGVATKFWFG